MAPEFDYHQRPFTKTLTDHAYDVAVGRIPAPRKPREAKAEVSAPRPLAEVLMPENTPGYYPEQL